MKFSRARMGIVAAVCSLGTVVLLPSNAFATTSQQCIDPFGIETICMTIGPGALPPGAAGSAYSGVTMTAEETVNGGAVGPLRPATWSASGLPPGLAASLDSSGNLMISGTPTSGCACSVSITGALPLPPFGTIQTTVTLPMDILGISQPMLPQGAVGYAYATPQPSPIGNAASVTWSASGLSGTGLSLDPSTGKISGTPTAVPGTVTLTATDNTNHLSTSVGLSLPILGITSTSLPGALAGSPYSGSPTAVGDSEPLSWTATGLPAGLSINAFTGQITGTPTSAGNSTVTLTVFDAMNQKLVTATLPLTVLGLNTSSLPGGTVGTPYSAPMSATGGAAPLTWSASNLPAGLSIDRGTGVISGTPTTVGNNVVTVTVTDSSTPAVAGVLTAALNIASAPPPALGQVVLGTITSVGAHATIPLSCQGSGTQVCIGSVVATTTEHVQSGTVQAITASKRRGKGKKKGGGKTTPVSKVVTVATGNYSITAGQSSDVSLTLNATGRKLLGEFFKLPVNLTVTGGVAPVPTGVTFKYGIINTTIAYAWSFNAQSTSADSLTISGLRSSYQVTVSCDGGGCPFSQKRPKAKGGGVAITPLLGRAKLQPHAVLKLVISAPNSVSQVEEFVIRAGAAPTVESLCQAPGVTTPGTCHAP